MLINLDPAAENLPYTPHIDIRTLITLDDACDAHNLGPNGALVYCIEYLQTNMHWLIDQIHAAQQQQPDVALYLIIDMPGQQELWTHHSAMRDIVHQLTRHRAPIDSSEIALDCRLCCIHLCDSVYCFDVRQFLSCLLLSLGSMCQLELPHINALSKMDLHRQRQRESRRSNRSKQLNIDYYSDAIDLHHLIDRMQKEQQSSLQNIALTKSLCELIESYSLVSFVQLATVDVKSLVSLLRLADKSVGYIAANNNNHQQQHQDSKLASTNDNNSHIECSLDEFEARILSMTSLERNMAITPKQEHDMQLHQDRLRNLKQQQAAQANLDRNRAKPIDNHIESNLHIKERPQTVTFTPH
jgi:GPN-loop GTPase